MKMKVSELKTHQTNKEIYGEGKLTESFIKSVQENGILIPLAVNPNGTVISGHRRLHAAQILNMETVPVQIVEYEDELAEKRAIIEYNRQRDKTFSQKMKEAQLLKEIEIEKAKNRMKTNQIAERHEGSEIFRRAEKNGRVSDIIAKTTGMGSGRNYEKAEKIFNAAENGDETAQDLVKKIDNGKITINSASLLLKRKNNENERKKNPVMPTGYYDVILADPPWKHEFNISGGRSVENHYPLMELEEIKKFKVPSAENSVLFLWATAPCLNIAFEVMQAWEFGYKTNAVWDKEIISTGFWFRGQHEHLLVGVKGKVNLPLPENRFSSVIRERRGKHSKKPAVVYEMIEKMFPNGKYLELFARERRDGWEVYGNEI